MLKFLPLSLELDLMDFLYQRDKEIIAFARPDLAVAGTGSSSVAQVADIHNPSRGISPKMSKGKNEWRVTLQDEYKYVKLFALTDLAWPNRAAAMKAVQTVVRQLLVIAPAMVSTKTERGCELTWPFDPASEPRFIEIGVRGYR